MRRVEDSFRDQHGVSSNGQNASATRRIGAQFCSIPFVVTKTDVFWGHPVALWL
jgi:hypothetical protein